MNLHPDPRASEELNIVEKEAISCVDASYSQVSMCSFEEPRCYSPPDMRAGVLLPPSGQTGTYDPNRIPASVFGPKPANHSEWSVASNESLFSIHMGNTSFSKDHSFMLYKSGDLQEMSSYFAPPPEPVMETKKVSNDANAKTGQAIPGGREEVYANQENSPRISCSSTQSFQFPFVNYEEERSPSVMKEKQQQLPAMQELGHDTKTSRGLKNNWFSCFSRCPFGC